MLFQYVHCAQMLIYNMISVSC